MAINLHWYRLLTPWWSWGRSRSRYHRSRTRWIDLICLCGPPMQPESRCIYPSILEDLFLCPKRLLKGSSVGAEGGVTGSGDIRRWVRSMLEMRASIQLLPFKHAPVVPTSWLDPPHIRVHPWDVPVMNLLEEIIQESAELQRIVLLEPVPPGPISPHVV